MYEAFLFLLNYTTVAATKADFAFHRSLWPSISLEINFIRRLHLMIKDKLFLEEFDEEPIEEARKSKRRHKHKKPPYSSITYTTGDIGLNIDRFNTAMGTTDTGDSGVGDGTGLGEGLITEAKRYVRRYYIRPQNIFCSNKAEILKALIELDDNNCSVYTLNNLGDDKDVSKLMNSDIIYYYDDGILYDKNRVKVMDYDLSIKKEEDRKKFAKVNSDSKEFKSEYEDRMTDTTELEESQEVLDGAFNAILDGIFDNCDYDVISADFTPMGDKVIVTLNHNAYDTEAAAEELMACLDNAGIPTIDWNTNGSNVFIFTLSPDNAFDLEFDDYNVFGEKLTEAKEPYCSICGEPIEGNGHTTDKGVICDGCELHFAIGG